MRGDYMLSAVSSAVNSEFGKNPKCYIEVPAQGCRLPYLFVSELQQDQRPDNYRRHNRFNFFDVRYHPDDKAGSKNREITNIRERLFECLQTIPTDDQPVNASGIRSEVIEGVLHVFADYPVRVLCPASDVPNMQTLETSENLKE